ncbi:MAG: YgeY family selenium metabolism-linked hydrolase [Actinomycetota bacterium]|nr:YgeY family selenium metabolism-linked hydrolase [Actinomycetota bacterium]
MPTPTPLHKVALTSVDDRRITDFAQRLVATASPSGEEDAVAAIVAQEMRDLGFDVDVDPFGNVTGVLDAGPGPCVMLDSHMDTVGVTDRSAWSFDPHGEISDGRLYGRGAMDMKGPLAASVYGVAALRDKLEHGRVVVSASVAEELVEGPMATAVAARIKPQAVIICEATSLRLSLGQRGRAEITVDVGGRSTHSSRPDLAINAVEVMTNIIAAIRDVSMPTGPADLGPAILVLTDIVSRLYPGNSVIPDRCVATYDRRTLPTETESDVLRPIRKAIGHALKSHPGATATAAIARDVFQTYTGALVDELNFAPAWLTSIDATIARIALAALEAADMKREISAWDFCTNGSGTAGRLGLPTIGFGPGDEALAHRIDEYIELAEMHNGARGYAAIVQALTEMKAVA